MGQHTNRTQKHYFLDNDFHRFPKMTFNPEFFSEFFLLLLNFFSLLLGTTFPPFILPSVAQSPPVTATIPATTVPTTITTTKKIVTTMTTSSPNSHPHNTLTTQTSIENAREMNMAAIVGGTTSTVMFLLLVIVSLIGVICYMHIRYVNLNDHKQ